MPEQPEEKEEKLPSLDEVFEKMQSGGSGLKFYVTVVCDYKQIKLRPNMPEMTVPMTSTIEITFSNRTPNQFKLDFFKRLNETSPIVAISWQTGSEVDPPESIKKMIEALQKPCQACNGKCSKGTCDCEKK